MFTENWDSLRACMCLLFLSCYHFPFVDNHPLCTVLLTQLIGLFIWSECILKQTYLVSSASRCFLFVLFCVFHVIWKCNEITFCIESFASSNRLRGILKPDKKENKSLPSIDSDLLITVLVIVWLEDMIQEEKHAHNITTTMRSIQWYPTMGAI
jgi:hypothetical protein